MGGINGRECVNYRAGLGLTTCLRLFLSWVVIRCCSLTGYINHSGKYIEINFNMKIPLLLLGRYARSI